MALQQELIQKAQSKEAYDEIADEIFRLRELRQKTTVDTAARDEQIKRINDLQDYIAQQTAHLTEFNESLVRRWIKQITIWDDHITVELKSGVVSMWMHKAIDTRNPPDHDGREGCLRFIHLTYYLYTV